MTKKHFIALADIIRGTKPRLYDVQGYTAPEAQARLLQWETDRDALARFCASQNSQFNRERWLGYIAGKNGPNGGAL